MPIRVTPVVPSTITVHLGLPDEEAENITVSFPDYVKNVASSEIYPTWEPAAIEANILAIVSFALNRVYTEFYPSRGYDFDITSTTAYDQKFIRGRNIFENISRAVDETFNDYIRRTDFVEPLAAKFCNGTTSTCDGLSQWGSQDLAQQGYGPMEILRYYYGEDIELVQDAPIQDLGRSYPGTPLRLGSQGENVVVVKTMLNRISQSYPAIPKIWPVTRVYDPQTEEAVRTFQRIFGLAADGVVGKATWYKMVYLYVGITQLAELVSEGQLFQTFSFQYPGLLRQGDRGGDVAVLQYMLALVAEFEPTVSAIRIDGVYGSDTARAVREYQAHVGLPADGIVGPQTWYSIYGEFTGIERDLRRDGINFPQNESVPAAAVRYGTTSRAGQFPGEDLRMGSSDQRGVEWYDATGIGGGNAVQSGAESSVYAPPPGDAVQLSAPAGDRRAVWRGDAGGGDALSAGAGPAGDRCGGRPHLGRHTAGMDGAGAGSGPTQKPAHFPRRGRADAAWRGGGVYGPAPNDVPAAAPAAGGDRGG